ncbi:MAG: DUF4180 domain-containing protein [Bacteroidales bacterium]|nr:DUF4180 domain-containing protein [Bacteroidales bacterium]MCF8456865.1 DUF4180 domain-containing protein [Bacteroidales bacterium]
MNLKIHNEGTIEIAELISKKVEINDVEDAIDLLGAASYLGVHKIIIRKEHLVPGFFDLKTTIAGDILQKFSNYRMKMAIIGNFTKSNSKSLNDFIFESNKTGSILFLSSFEEALQKLGK